jgi:hypothetical protein
VLITHYPVLVRRVETYQAFLISPLDESERLARCPCRFEARKEAQVHSTESVQEWVHFRAGLDAAAKEEARVPAGN